MTITVKKVEALVATMCPVDGCGSGCRNPAICDS
ncbi:hypothetical protein IW245_001736 [Longispora fulva]|uniref:Uncharacterized protein n=1 Tax=Longispora fulva TaxID=619741 RepID=A0A8J7KVP3_9ACTN|nr:hypothetical protein [Longispora fulva]